MNKTIADFQEVQNDAEVSGGAWLTGWNISSGEMFKISKQNLKKIIDLGNVNNTSDADKPISTAAQSELDKKPENLQNEIITGLWKFNQLLTAESGENVGFQIPSVSDDFTIKNNLGATIFTLDDNGDITIHGDIDLNSLTNSIAGIQGQNLLDKTSTEIITANWKFESSAFVVENLTGSVLLKVDGKDSRANSFIRAIRGSEGKDKSQVQFCTESSLNWVVGLQYNNGGVTPNFYISRHDSISGTSEFSTGTHALMIDTLDNVYLPSAYDNTIGSAANVYVANGGRLYRSTSSKKYKTEIKPISVNEAKFMKINPVEFKDKRTLKKFIGFIAEEVHELGISELVDYDLKGNPDAIHYGNFTALNTMMIQNVITELNRIKKQCNVR